MCTDTQICVEGAWITVTGYEAEFVYGGGDDAAVWRLDDERALVSTADFITPVVDDPRVFGRVAAANSLSDVYAMGGKPLLALNLLGYPPADVPGAVLGEILVGAAET